MDYSPGGIYHNYKTVPANLTWTARRVGGRDGRTFEGLVVRDANPPDYYSLGLNNGVWNVRAGECGVNAILHILQGEEKFKKLTRGSLLEEMGVDDDDELTVKHIMD